MRISYSLVASQAFTYTEAINYENCCCYLKVDTFYLNVFFFNFTTVKSLKSFRACTQKLACRAASFTLHNY